MIEMEKLYNPNDFEDRIYDFWQKNDKFKPVDSEKEPFVVVIPPPNVTGVLHMGHGLNNSLQDIIVRYNRMIGRPTLWVPGTDHAGIATQNVVERMLKKEGLTKNDLGREKFIEKTWEVKKAHHQTITEQLKKIGSSCDWSRERFTLDDGLSKAVREVFVTLYERDLLYKGEYLVNYCPSCGTALADDEVDHKEENGKLYRIKYPYSDGSGYLIVATTRPETMFGDTAVAVNPKDERYKDLVGKTLDLPLTNKKIKVIADDYVDVEFGSGAVKITPAHDPNDWEIGNRHNLEKINILTPDGRMNEHTPEFVRGMKVQAARKATIDALTEQGFFIDYSDLKHQVGHCYRCSTIVEPYMSKQWFVRMKSMADKALKAWEKGEVNFYPKKWGNTYRHWLENIRDWCISRQLWWGHRIPAWYCDDCGETIVSRDDVDSCPKCGSKKVHQDNDVLDTWFSSWLWPFSTLGWPNKTEDLKKYYPTSTLITAYDIIFFWVSRMIMAGIEFLGEVPFKDIYIHQLVRDKQGRKMSKSLGNGIDPLEIVKEYGADALKFTIAYMAVAGQDILVDKDSFKIGAKFANKIWNATRYILSNIEDSDILKKEELKFDYVDKWIYDSFNTSALNIQKALSEYKYSEAAHEVYQFFWNDFCDWYIEVSKIYLYGDDEHKSKEAKSKIIYLLEASLRLLHPFLPFITEEIYQKLPKQIREDFLISANYPVFEEKYVFTKESMNFKKVQDLVSKIRTLRSEWAISPDKQIKVIVKLDENAEANNYFTDNKNVISAFVKASSIEFTSTQISTEGSVGVSGSGFVAYVYIKDAIDDLEKEIAKQNKEKANIESFISRTEQKLSNEKYLSNAPADVIEREKSMLHDAKDRLAKVEENIMLLK